MQRFQASKNFFAKRVDLPRFKRQGDRFRVKALWQAVRRAGFTALAISLSAGCSLSAQPSAKPPLDEKPLPTTIALALAPQPSPPPLMLPSTPATPAPPLTHWNPVLPVLAYADHVRTLPGSELAQEIIRLGDSNLPADQLRLGIALSQTLQPYDLARAQELLQRVLTNPSADAKPLQTLARLLAARLTAQRRVEDLLDRQNQQLRDLQHRLEQTQDKLEALKEIERSLSRRSLAVPPSPPRSHPRLPNP